MTRGLGLVLVAGLLVVAAVVTGIARSHDPNPGATVPSASGSTPSAHGSTPSAKGGASSAAAPRPRPSSLPTAVPATRPTLDAKQRAASSKAEEHLHSFLGKSSTALARGNGKADLGSSAAGPALGEIQSLAVQYHHEDMSVSGAPKVLGSEVLSADLGGQPPSVTLAVCLDNRPVVVRDAKGRSLSGHRSPDELTVLNLYQLQQLDGDWVVVNHSIPADSSCKNLKGSS